MFFPWFVDVAEKWRQGMGAKVFAVDVVLVEEFDYFVVWHVGDQRSRHVEGRIGTCEQRA